MDEYTLTLSLSQLEATSIALKTHRDHLNQVLNGINQIVMKIYPTIPDKPPEEPASLPIEEIPNG